MLKKTSREKKVRIWADIAQRLQKPARQRASVNVGKLDRLCKKGETVIIPGKLLAGGAISKAINVACANCSVQACEKIKAAGGKCLTIEELMKAKPKGSDVRIIK